MNTIVIINSKASRANKKNRVISKELKKHGIKAKVLTTTQNNKLEDVLLQASKLKPKLLIVGGGDGTVISAIDYMLGQGYTGSFAVLPLGTANYLARNLGMSTDYKKAIKQIVKGNEKSVNLAEANGKIFSLIADIGITSLVSENVQIRYKKILGQGAYLFEGFKQLFKHRDFDYKITSNGETITGRAHQIVVINADLNFQFSVAPENKLEHNRLMIAIYGENISLLRLLFYTFLYIISFGRLRKAVQTYEVKSAMIETTPNKKYSVDGELIDFGPLSVRISDKKIKFVC